MPLKEKTWLPSASSVQSSEAIGIRVVVSVFSSILATGLPSDNCGRSFTSSTSKRNGVVTGVLPGNVPSATLTVTSYLF